MTLFRLALLALVTALPGIATAHPEDEIQTRLLFGMEQGKVTYIGESWTFGLDTSEWLTQMLGQPKDRLLKGTDLDKLMRTVRENTAPSYLYTRIFVSGGEVPEPTIYGVHASVGADGLVSLAFALALPQPADPGAVRVALSDPDQFITLVPAGNTPIAVSANQSGCVPGLDSNAPFPAAGPDPVAILARLSCRN